MNLVTIFFYLFGFLAILGASFMLYTRNVLHAAFSLLITLLSLAAIFILLLADFVAVTQIMVYVGGVLVLILFGVMLSNRVNGQAVQSQSVNRISGGLVASALFAGLTYLILSADYLLPKAPANPVEGAVSTKSSITAIGIQLITNFALPFEVVSLVLLIALMGASYISTEDKND
ncbi:NADH-quinone oxidoreductase subunit J family protein [Adhaeribacter aquaticus]|uniref:NADH-quinone oxidoreductase subunit J family protein n=1 Tax=Adhaeribacter aquaticus TaxID=299567 RepID=UPI00047DF945|nr:NADH-quinone oxidoreductase subunit J [Adhaeribacter aquaticus]